MQRSVLGAERQLYRVGVGRALALACVVSLIASWVPGCARALQNGTLLGFSPAAVLATDAGLYVSDPVGGTVRRLGREGLETVAVGLPRAYGLARRADGAVCVSHYTSDDAMTRRSAVSCLLDGTRTEYVVGVGQGINGIGAAEDGLWLAAWVDTDGLSRDGLLAFVRDGVVVRQILFDAVVPQFVVPLPDGGLALSVWTEDADGPGHGRILLVSPDGAVETFGPAEARPTGLALVGDRWWFSDHRDGALVALDREGNEVGRLGGLEEPLGVAVTSGLVVCVAEALGHRVSCLEPSVLPHR